MPDAAGSIHFRADRGDARLRLDQVLVRRIVDVSRMSRSAAQQWIEAGAVRVDGRLVRRSSARVHEGAQIHVTLPASATRKAVPAAEPGDLRVLYEDEAFVAVDKPPGVVVHPSYKQASNTLLNRLLWHARARTGISPGILTRIDKGTSGLVVVAWTADVHRTLQRDAAAGLIRKEYLAVVQAHPRPQAGTIVAALARDPADRRRVVVTAAGAHSETRYVVVAENGSTALVRCELVTGRTHQIRVHLASRGWPIVGDVVYGVASEVIARPALHAWRLTLPHPITRHEMTIVAPLADDMEQLYRLADGQNARL
jgi:23S rRNA pseudouridine1911/1915/1917 synthase